MATVELSVTIARPVADVYRVLTTPELTPRWSSNAIDEHVTTAGPLRVGTRRHATIRRFGGGTTENEIEVTELEPERRIAVRSVQAPVPFTSTWSFTPVDGGTRGLAVGLRDARLAAPDRPPRRTRLSTDLSTRSRHLELDDGIGRALSLDARGLRPLGYAADRRVPSTP